MIEAPSRDVWLAGVDGCKGGWIAAFVRATGGKTRVDVVRRFADVLAAPEAPAVIAVDIPIGLLDRSEPRGRAPERVVRPLLGPRRSSVFRVPSRVAVYAGVDPAIPDQRSATSTHARSLA